MFEPKKVSAFIPFVGSGTFLEEGKPYKVTNYIAQRASLNVRPSTISPKDVLDIEFSVS